MAKGKRKKPSIQKRSSEDCSSNVGQRNRRVEQFDVRGDKINDLSWYASKTQELSVAATTNFLSRAGRKSNFGVNELRNHAFPGIMSIYLSPAFGINRSAVDPANVCAQNLYTYVRSANSGARNYDAIDLFIYYGAVTQLYSWLSYIRRTLHALDKYSYENQYVPEGMVTAMGFNYADLRVHQAALEVYFNNVVTRAASLALPGDIDAIRRSIWVYENAYWDDSSVQSQMYIFNPRTVLKYALDSDGAGMLTEVRHSDTSNVYGGAGIVNLHKSVSATDEAAGVSDCWQFHSDNALTYQDIVDITEELLQAIFYDQDIAIMSGDVLKAYGKESLFKLAPYVRGEVWNPVYDETALSMIENATLTGPLRGVELAQDPDKKYLVYDPYCILFNADCANAYLGNRMLNFHKAQPTEADVIEATRLTVPFRGYSSADDNIGLISSCGAEIAEFAVMWRFYYQDDGSVQFGNVHNAMVYAATMSTGIRLESSDIEVGSDNSLTTNVYSLLNSVSLGFSKTLNDFYEDSWAIMNLENFKQHPTVLMTILSSAISAKFSGRSFIGSRPIPNSDYRYTPVVDADVYSFVGRDWIDNLNRACVQGLYLLKF